MKRLFLIPISIFCLAFAYQRIQFTVNPEEKICDLPLNWSVYTGNVSFRSNIAHLGENIVIGSNGGNYMDYFIDNGNGVYILNPKTGKVQLNFANEKLGDMDVNGILVYDNKIYFGNDNDEIICADNKGKIIFRQDASGDIEHRPILIKKSNEDQIVFAMETGEVRSINPISGKINWSFYHPNFEGYKSNDNRTAFKLKMHFYSGEKFFVEPKVIDLNNDQVDDLVYNSDDSEIFAINGKNGKLITKITTQRPEEYYGNFNPSFHRSTPIVLNINNQPLIMIPYVCEYYGDREGAKTKSELRFFNPSGNEIKRLSINKNLNFYMAQQRGNSIFLGSHLLDFSNGIDNYELIAYDNGIVNNYSAPRVSNEILKIGGDDCIIMCFEMGFTMLNNEKRDYNTDLCIYNISKRKFEKIIHLQTSSEFNPILGDFNSDNNADILVGCHNGMLYNFDLGYPASSIIH
ncbi:MAG: hypothetical protein RLZ10_743 [Bacteroidota bacterium]|jgi:outer membrane protein assembly factor BamB